MSFESKESPNERSYRIAKDVVYSELNSTDTASCLFSIDDIIRDRLIVNGRQDAAHALLNTTVLLRELKTLKILLWALLIFGVIILCRLL